MLRFVSGLVAGALLVPVLIAAGVAALFASAAGHDLLLGLPRQAPPPSIGVSVSGADVSAAGGVRVVVAAPETLIRMDCRGACDDFTSEIDLADKVEVLGPDGRCLTCWDVSWRRPLGWFSGQRPTAVAGRPLKIEKVAER